ncbi:putative esterase azaC [Lachnellula arida]|uniref:Putative esterase azaC n=1 Tax=Lachnellula arida TaxID=1316785 RepID=A0A8T9AZ95_9HELO|nr:putative esterase azaC [Lachnellula arida]
MAASRPRIACFHGGGSNSKIYEFQCARLEELLKPDFQLVYFDAPFTRSAGPGVLPAFDAESFRPYKTWFKGEDAASQDGSGYDGARDGVDRVWEMMRGAGEGGGGEWIAAMGFSQGSRVVGGLLLDQQVRAKAGLERGDGDIELRFGVLCMGGGAPMISAASRDAQPGELELVSIPTFHLHGLKDANLLPGRKQLATYYDPQTTKLMEIDYHHAMPWNHEDLHGFVKFLKDAYSATQGKP